MGISLYAPCFLLEFCSFFGGGGESYVEQISNCYANFSVIINAILHFHKGRPFD